MRKLICILVVSLVSWLYAYPYAEENCFRLERTDISVKDVPLHLIIDKDTCYRPFTDTIPISCFAVSGNIKKISKEYYVRIVLKDNKNREYLVFEAYEELNNKDFFEFELFGEETQFLENIVPESLKIFIHDASVELSSISIGEAVSNMDDWEPQMKKLKEQQLSEKIESINAYNRENRRPWIAGKTKLAEQPYDTKRIALGIADGGCSGGIEYYTGGYFVVGHGTILTESPEEDPFVDSFDWRNRHGKNWMTSVKDQGFTHYCTAFAAVGCLEAITRLYYNNADMDIDLSEQEIASCADTIPHLALDGLTIATVMNYLQGHGVCDELSYPFVYSNIDSYYDIQSLTCESSNLVPLEQVSIAGTNLSIGGIHDIKYNLIKNGPLFSGWHRARDSDHAMALAGYGKISIGDTITSFDASHGTGTVNIDSTWVGSTYWVFKNSYGNDTLRGPHEGYYYLIFTDMKGTNGNFYSSYILPPVSFILPINTLNHTNEDIIVEDADGDGYYYWGLGEKPQGCPPWIPDEPDGDDADDTKSTIDSYGHLTNIADIIRAPRILTSDDIISSPNQKLWENIIIPGNYTLTISGSMICMGNTSVTIESGGTLIIDGGILANADINITAGGTLIVRNGGKVYIRSNHELTAPTGCVIQIDNGEILGPYIKKTANWE